MQVFPHIRHLFRVYFSRIFIEIKILLPLLFLLLLITNLLVGKTSFETNKDKVLDNPEDFSARFSLVEQLKAGNQFLEAQTELQTAKTTRLSEIDRLQLETEQQTIGKITQEPEEIKKQIVFWEKIVSEFPYFRDAYIKLAILNWRIDHIFDAKKFLVKAAEIDPNNEAILKLSGVITE